MTHEDWHTDDFPEFRSSPPWVMEEMIAAGRGLATPILGDPSAARIAASVAEAAGGGAPLATVGCGTSEHGAMAVAEQLTAALGGRAVVHPRQAFEAMLDPWPGVCVAISHDGGTAATVAAMESARRGGAAVGLVTAVPGAAAAAAADRVLVTPVRDRSWCHTVGYLSPVLAGAAVAGGLGTVSDPDAAERTISDAIDRRPAIRQVAGELYGVERYLTVGSGADRIAARELALKIEEGVRVPAAARDLETILHGHWVAVDQRTAVVLLLTDARGGGARAARATQMLMAARALGARTAAIVSPAAAEGLPVDAISAGSVDVPAAGDLPAPTASLLASAPALQLLTLELVHLAGVNPDLIRREEAPYRQAAQIAESSFPPHG
jgi:glucosamine 6-phosphate synthetase-like amidotransferase/phosphosugar isomerase protein